MKRELCDILYNFDHPTSKHALSAFLSGRMTAHLRERAAGRATKNSTMWLGVFLRDIIMNRYTMYRLGCMVHHSTDPLGHVYSTNRYAYGEDRRICRECDLQNFRCMYYADPLWMSDKMRCDVVKIMIAEGVHTLESFGPIYITHDMIRCENADMLTIIYASGIKLVHKTSSDIHMTTSNKVPLETILSANPRENGVSEKVMSAMTFDELDECVRIILSHQIFTIHEVIWMVQTFIDRPHSIYYEPSRKVMDHYLSRETMLLLERRETLDLFSLVYASCRRFQILEKIDIVKQELKK